MAVFFFVLLDVVYYNLDSATFGYEVMFKFKIPGLITLESYPIPVGFLLLLSFCSGMIAIAMLEALPSFYKSLELRTKNKKIRQLERELTLVRQIASTPSTGHGKSSDDISGEEGIQSGHT